MIEHHGRHLYAVGDDFYDEDAYNAYAPRTREPQCAPGPFDDLSAHVGSAEALATLEAAPLPDEAFDWSAVEPRDRPFVEQVLALSDRYCEEMLDVEYRTITRRILARVAVRDPRVLRRSNNAERVAAGLVWLAGKGNGEFGRRGRRTSERLWRWFGVSSCSDRGQTLRRAAGLEPEGIVELTRYSVVLALGDAALLHSDRRKMLIAQRNIIMKVAGERHPITVSPDGRTVDVRALHTKIAVAAKGRCGTRGMVLLGLGDSVDDARFFAAHDSRRARCSSPTCNER